MSIRNEQGLTTSEGLGIAVVVILFLLLLAAWGFVPD